MHATTRPPETTKTRRKKIHKYGMRNNKRRERNKRERKGERNKSDK
jgi:hypothetical protein